jgi:hypothetical protein
VTALEKETWRLLRLIGGVAFAFLIDFRHGLLVVRVIRRACANQATYAVSLVRQQGAACRVNACERL